MCIVRVVGREILLAQQTYLWRWSVAHFFFVGHCLWVCDEFGFSIYDEYVINCYVSYELAEWHRQSSGGGRNGVARNGQEAWQEQCGWIECAQQKCIMFNKNVERDDDGL